MQKLIFNAVGWHEDWSDVMKKSRDKTLLFVSYLLILVPKAGVEPAPGVSQTGF